MGCSAGGVGVVAFEQGWGVGAYMRTLCCPLRFAESETALKISLENTFFHGESLCVKDATKDTGLNALE